MAAALIRKGNRILLVHNNKHGSLRVEPPGGKREDGETLEGCLVREVMEELGCKVRVSGEFGVYETNSPEGPFRVRMYWAEVVSGVPSLQDNEIGKITKLGYYTLEEMQEFQASGELVPNLCSALKDLRFYLR